MNRKQLSIAVCSALLLIAALIYLSNTPGDRNEGQPLKDPVIAEMMSKINESEIYNTVYSLQNFVTRRNGTAGNAAARTYLFNRLSDIPGLNIVYQGDPYKNIIATLTGTDPSSNAIFIVGAHYDSKVYPLEDLDAPAPGATDNGGGVAIVLELARIMSEYRFDHTIEFALWNAEEVGCIGSAHYAQAAYDDALNISFYLNFDASCYDPDDRFVLDVMYNDQSQWVSDMITKYSTLYNIDFTLTYNRHDCTSDHREFWNRGYTAIATHQEEHGDFVHTASDTIDKVSTSYAKKNGQLGMSVLAKLAEVHAGASAH